MIKRIFTVITLILTLFFLMSTLTLAEEKKDKPAATQKETQKKEKDETVEKILKYLNSATQEELEAISGIGPKLAQLIMKSRPYESLDDVLAVKGIGEKKLAKIKEFIENPPTEAAEEKKAEDSKKDVKEETKKEAEEEAKEDTKEDSKKGEKKTEEKKSKK